MSMSKLSLISLSVLVPSLVFADGDVAPAATQQSSFGPIIFLVAILAFMYFLVWRPQQKKAKAHRELVSAVSMDDEVLLSGGMIGKVSATYDQYVAVNLGDTVVTVQRSSVANVLPKGTMESLKKSQ